MTQRKQPSDHGGNTFTILGETYRELEPTDMALWRGDLVVLNQDTEPDARVYMVCLSDDRKSFHLINYVGYKAGAKLTISIPLEASEPGAQNIRLSWLKKNWQTVIPIGSYETTSFLSWTPE